MTEKRFSLISIPIGDPEDITLKAVNRLKVLDLLLCEEPPVAAKLLRSLEIPFYQGVYQEDREELYLFLWDRKSTSKEARLLMEDVFPHIHEVGYISGCGSPVFEDPGKSLYPYLKSFKKEYIGGVSSLSQLMLHLPEGVRRFRVEGFLPRNKDLRIQLLNKLKREGEAVFLMETPYRMRSILQTLNQELSDWNLLLGYRMTMKGERVLFGGVKKVCAEALTFEPDEFVLFLVPRVERPGISQEGAHYKAKSSGGRRTKGHKKSGSRRK